MGPEGRERLPRLSKEEIADVTPCRRAVREMLEPDQISGHVRNRATVWTRTFSAVRKSVAFPYYLLTSAFSGFAPGRLAGALCATDGPKLGPWSSELRREMRQRDELREGSPL